MKKISIEEFFETIRDSKFEDKTNTFHPDQVDKLTDLETIKVYYRAMFGCIDFERKNLAKHYLNALRNK
jgi:hypothetical protein